jgi:SAM-dependent methyltransferase
MPARSTDRRFAARQAAYFASVDAAKFHWQTAAGLFAATERELVASAKGAGRFLEVGCGEGGNLVNLGPREALTVGLDRAYGKAQFAAGHIAWARFLCADAVRLPFRADAFDRVLCRDVLHHLTPEQARWAVGELCRVCRPGSEVVLIEPNSRNPLMGLFALLVPAERGALRSNPEGLTQMLLAAGAARVECQMMQALPVVRVLAHYRYGIPGLAQWGGAHRALSGLNRACHLLLPRSRWAYAVIRGIK